MRTRAAGLALSILLLVGVPAFAGAAASPDTETILSFDALLQVAPSGKLTVTERITVSACGEQIKRGIYRDLPLIRRSILGPIRQPFEIVAVRRDGLPEPYHTQEVGDGIRIYVGKADILLDPGNYTYEITYAFERQIAFFADFDELYWNVTGNAWIFPIEKVTATIHLPDGARMINGTAYTGYAGSTDSDATQSVDGGGNPVFTTTRPFDAGEGLTIAISWPKGFVLEPTRREKLLALLADSTVTLLAVGVLGIVVGYYLIMWLRVGRDPAKGTIVPIYTPRLSPAAMRYLERMRYDGRCLAAALLDLAVKGHVSIRDEEEAIELRRRSGSGQNLSQDELTLRDALLLREGQPLTIDRENRGRIRSANAALKAQLEKRYDREYVRQNRGYFIGGLVLTVISAFVVAIFSHDPFGAIFMTIWLTGWTCGTGALIFTVVREWQTALADGGVVGLILVFVFSLFVIPFCAAWGFGVYMLADAAGPVAAGFLVLAVFVNVLFFRLLKAPTKLGRVALDEIEGLRLYLTVAEEDRLRFQYGPGRTMEAFERFLPYAVALGIETAWSERFADILEKNRMPDGSSYRPSWYSSTSGFSTGSLGSLSSSLTGAIASATASSGSSSSSGGGSSGGGGGGGGGGGW